MLVVPTPSFVMYGHSARVLDYEVREVELFVRFYDGVPLAQVIRHFAIKPDGKYAVDYWCDICAISMVEDGPCDCCQMPSVLRELRVE